MRVLYLRPLPCLDATIIRLRRRPQTIFAGAFCTAAFRSSVPDPVISTAWLAKNMCDVSILDVRGRVDTRLVQKGVESSEYIACYDEYLDGHIPGAVFFNWVKDGVTNERFPVELFNDTSQFSAMIEAKGVSTNKPVVVYDNSDCLFASRLWWSLVRHGHEHVYVLDGGYQKWIAEGRPTELYEPCTLKVYADYEPSNPRPDLRVSYDEILQLIKEEGVAFVDARNSDQYLGLVRRSKRAGRIPNAINIPRKSLISANGSFKSVDELQEVFIQAGLIPEQHKKLVAYCNGGVASCSVLLAWHRIGGQSAWSNYDGSWNEWGNRNDLPIESEQISCQD